MEKGRGKGRDTLQTDDVFTRKEYIERDAAIKAIESVPDGNWRSIRYAKEVKAIPAADVAPVRHGRWKWEFADNGWANHICSECGYTKNTDIHVRLGYHYCPNCGARMDGDGE